MRVILQNRAASTHVQKFFSKNFNPVYDSLVSADIGIARGGPGGPAPPNQIPLTTKSYDNIA